MFANVPLRVLEPYRSPTAPPCLLRLRFSGDLTLDVTTFLRVAEADMARFPFYFSYTLLRVRFIRRSCEGRGALWVDRFLASGALPASLRSPIPGESVSEWVDANDTAWAAFCDDMQATFKDGPQIVLRRMEQTTSVAYYADRWRQEAELCGVDVDTHFNCRWFIWGLRPAIRARFTERDWQIPSLEHVAQIAQKAERELNRSQRPQTFHASPGRWRRGDSAPALSGLPSPIHESAASPEGISYGGYEGGGSRRRRATELTHRVRSSEQVQWAPLRPQRREPLAGPEEMVATQREVLVSPIAIPDEDQIAAQLSGEQRRGSHCRSM